MLLRTLFFTLIFSMISVYVHSQEVFPDGTPVSDWFYQTDIPDIKTLGTQYVITEHGVIRDSTAVQTERIQQIIDQAAESGGGVIIVPEGVFLSGAVFFKPGTHLYLEKNARLKGSDDISDFPVVETRIEGQSVKYFPALVNADKADRFTISGEGTLDGNGLRYWKAFWLRRQWNPECTNMDEMRPRLLYVSRSDDVLISGITLKNSPFWTSHYYKCKNLKLLGLTFLAPSEPVKAPSSDAIDLDVCSNVLVKDCYMSVNDDAIALKGGKGPQADQDDNNGGNYNIIIEDCDFGFCHSVLTCGSESIHNKNIILRRSTADNARRLLHLKMRPDTPQKYEYILMEDLTGNVGDFLFVQPWTQFFDLKGHKTMPMSYSDHITLRNIEMSCNRFFNVSDSEQYKLSDFLFENLKIEAKNPEINRDFFSDTRFEDVYLNGKKVL